MTRPGHVFTAYRSWHTVAGPFVTGCNAGQPLARASVNAYGATPGGWPYSRQTCRRTCGAVVYSRATPGGWPAAQAGQHRETGIQQARAGAVFKNMITIMMGAVRLPEVARWAATATCSRGSVSPATAHC